MALCAKRRFQRRVFALLFAISSVVHAYAVTVSMMTMPTTTIDASASDGDDMGCCASDKATHAACVAICASAFAILAEPVTTPYLVTTQGVEPALQLPLTSSDRSPDPPPPKFV
jgi:hypothetical protein